MEDTIQQNGLKDRVSSNDDIETLHTLISAGLPELSMNVEVYGAGATASVLAEWSRFEQSIERAGAIGHCRNEHDPACRAS